MVGLFVILAAAVLSAVAMVLDGIAVKREFHRVNAELKSCNELIHGYKEGRA